MAIYGRNRIRKDVYEDYSIMDKKEFDSNTKIPDQLGRVNQKDGNPLYVSDPRDKASKNRNILTDIFKDNKTHDFKYGLEINGLNNYDEDPVIFGFDVIIDTINSPLFTDVSLFFNQFSSRIPEIQSREQIYIDFMQHLSIFFGSNGFKGHYLKKIKGLDKLVEKTIGGLKNNQQFVKYTEDLITFTMYEDLNINGGYLAMLYKMLSYSRLNGKTLLPDNILRFDMSIIISEVRNYNKVKRSLDGGDLNVLNDNVSRYIYNLYDCQFIFDNMSHPSEVSNDENNKTDSFDFLIAYKFSTLEMEKFKLIEGIDFDIDDDIRYLNNKSVSGNVRFEGSSVQGEDDLGYRSGESYIKHPKIKDIDNLKEVSDIDNLKEQEKNVKKESIVPKEVDKGKLSELTNGPIDLGGIPEKNKFGSKIGEIVKKTGKFAIQKFKFKRDQLINNALSKIRTSTGLRRISDPINVYQNPTVINFAMSQFKNFVNDAVSDFINDSPFGKHKKTPSEQNQKYNENIKSDIPQQSNNDNKGFKPGSGA